MTVLMALSWTCFALSLVGTGQPAGPTLEQVVETILYRGIWEGQGVKALRRSGDAAGVAVTKVISDRDLDRTQMDLAVEILSTSFSDPTWIQAVSDREPRTTLLVLRYLECSTHDPMLKAKVATTRERIQEQATKPIEPGQ